MARHGNGSGGGGGGGDGLGSRTLLDKVDQLRELGISSMVPLPQMVVVGDQSAGKSSVLESLTGFSFPRAVTLCTRHATEIICRREETESIVVSIHAVDADPQKAREFRRQATNLEPAAFAKIFEDAAKVMGIKSEPGEYGSAFSRDILRVEISGPNEDHLTVIDVPGMFENETPGVTTSDDIDLVKNMVRNYINESRTIILAVVPCNGDIANQKILKYAIEADPEGKRTLGVLTKPDLAVENAMKNVVVELVEGKRRDLTLGYCLVKNRSADDSSSSKDERNRAEKVFFDQAPWNRLPQNRLGIPALKHRIQNLLMDRTRSDFPIVRAELSEKLKQCQRHLADMGEARSTTEQQRLYVGKIASRFNKAHNMGLDAHYTRSELFTRRPDLKLITRVREINELFSKVVYSKGHSRAFMHDEAVGLDSEDGKKVNGVGGGYDYDDDDEDDREALYDQRIKYGIPFEGEVELDGLLANPYRCKDPSDDDIMKHIEEEYLTSRGYELGTFSSEMLPTTFKEQARKWPKIALAHVSNAILIVHHFIRSVLEESCPDVESREELWAFLLEDLLGRYKKAMDHTKFLLSVEFHGKPITYNPSFSEALAITQMARFQGARDDINSAVYPVRDDTVTIDRDLVTRLLEAFDYSRSSVENIGRDIHDVLHAYYEIARNRFVDVICQQVIDHFLLLAEGGPLTVLSDNVVLSMTRDTLEAIAGEDMASRDRREKLAKDVEDLTKALKILKG